MTREEKVKIAHEAELKYCVHYLKIDEVSYKATSEDGKRYKKALEYIALRSSLREVAFAKLIALLNREALYGTIIKYFDNMNNGHPLYEAAPVLILVKEIYYYREDFMDLISEFGYSSVDKFGKDIRAKLSFFVDMINSIAQFHMGDASFPTILKNLLDREVFSCHQLSKGMKAFSLSVIDEVPVVLLDDKDLEKNIIKFEAYSQKERWETVSDIRTPQDFICQEDKALFPYASGIINQWKVPDNVDGSNDKFFILGKKLYETGENIYERNSGLVLMYFSDTLMPKILLTEYQKLLERNGDDNMVTKTPIAFEYMARCPYNTVDKELISNGLLYTDHYKFVCKINDFIEKYFYLKGCVDNGVKPDVEVLIKKYERKKYIFHSIYFNLYTIYSESRKDGIGKYTNGDFLIIPTDYFKNAKDVVCDIKFPRPVIGTNNLK